MLDGELALDDVDVQKHIGQCLGCRACETACPSGVPYGHLLEATRATMQASRTLPLGARLALWVFAHPVLLRIVMAVSRLLAATPIPTLAAKLGSRYGFAMAMLASTDFPLERGAYTPRDTGELGTVALLLGCVMEGLLTETNRATERVLTYNGYHMMDASGQRCCGALHAHAGDLETARGLARRNIVAFERSGAEYVMTNSAGCGAMLKEYGLLLQEDASWRDRATAFSQTVRDVSELLAAAGPKPGGPLPFTATYDAPCHLYHAQRVTVPPLAVLAAIPGLELIPLQGSEQCCGSAGIYTLVEPEVSDAVLAPKLANIHASGASLVVTGNPGCLMQIGAGVLRAGLQARVVHPVDLLDASYAAL
ncbi:MAG TPA: heterodisulfide reductase-related iron-sulfur binding cluster, partial [Gemmatimonadaceae bacterium]|nr:heterodisulfide reductase-related iron-sulfur binding cluster [Gemmatimonadaceae bacterium]